MRRWIISIIFTFAMSGLVAAEAPPARVVSANLCTDQLLMTLADPDQIASLSPYARDPEMSHLASQAGAFPQNRGSGEDLIQLRADLVLVGPFDSRYTKALLDKRGMRFESFAPWSNLEQGRTQIRFLAKLLGHPDRGERLIERIDRARQELEGVALTGGRKPRALVLHRRGYVLHAGVTGELLEHAGFENAAAQLGLASGGFVSLETILQSKPDFMIVSGLIGTPEDQGQAFLEHPALKRLYPEARRLVLPDRLTLCGGLSTLDLIRQLASEIRQKVTSESN